MKVPNLRFPGFEGEWITIHIADLCDEFRSGKNIKANEISDEGDYPVYGGNGLRGFTQRYNYDGEYVLIGRQGALCGNVRLFKGKGYMTEHAIVVQANKQNNTKFLLYLLDNMNLGQYSDQSAQPGLAVNKLLKIKVLVPELSEQDKIATFLSLLDERISTQSKIIEDLKLLKSTISEKLFNRQVRFNEQGGYIYPKWKVRKLRDFMSVPDKIQAEYIDKNKLLTVKLHLKGVMKNDSTEALSSMGTIYYVRRKGQFIYGKQNLFNGAFGIIPDQYDGFLSTNDVPSLDINYEKINPLYLIYYMGRRSYYMPLEDIAIGSGSKRIHEQTLLNLEMSVPSLEEQASIASIIYAIDRKIDMETSILQRLNKQKKYLLQQMFI